MTTATIDADWAKKKARWMVEREIHLIRTSAVPSSEPARATIEAYVVLCLLTEDEQHAYNEQADEAERSRKRQLTKSRVTRLLEEIRDDRAAV